MSRQGPCRSGLLGPPSLLSCSSELSCAVASAPRCTWVHGWVLGAGGPPVVDLLGVCSCCLILPALSTAQGLAAGRSGGGTEGMGVSPDHPRASSFLCRGLRRPHTLLPPRLVPLQHVPCCLHTSPWSGLTLRGTLASAFVFCDHLMGTGDKGAWNRAAGVPCGRSRGVLLGVPFPFCALFKWLWVSQTPGRL